MATLPEYEEGFVGKLLELRSLYSKEYQNLENFFLLIFD